MRDKHMAEEMLAIIRILFSRFVARSRPTWNNTSDPKTEGSVEQDWRNSNLPTLPPSLSLSLLPVPASKKTEIFASQHCEILDGKSSFGKME